MDKVRLSIIVAIGKHLVIGRSNGLLWPIPDDLKRFKQLTMGHPVIMGRKTFESILKSLGKPLPGRTNIVVTRNTGGYPMYKKDVILSHSIKEAVEKAGEIDQQEVFVIGGAQIYEQVLPFADKLYATLVDAEESGDAFFPPYEHLFTKKVFEEAHEHNGLKYTWVDLEK